MRVRFPLLLVIFAFAFHSLAAQQSPSASPSAIALLQQALRALAGNQSVTDITLTGSARRIAGSDDESGQAVLKALATGESRIDLALPSGTRSEVRVNSANGPVGSWTGPDGVVRPIAYHNLLADTGLFPAVTLAGFVSSPNSVLSYVGPETRDGAAVTHLSAFRQSPGAKGKTASLQQHLSEMDIFLDASTRLPVAVTFNIHPDNDAGLDIPVEVRFSDYRSVSGAQIPFHVQKFLNNGLILDLKFETAALNTGLAAAQFQVGE